MGRVAISLGLGLREASQGEIGRDSWSRGFGMMILELPTRSIVGNIVNGRPVRLRGRRSEGFPGFTSGLRNLDIQPAVIKPADRN